MVLLTKQPYPFDRLFYLHYECRYLCGRSWRTTGQTELPDNWLPGGSAWLVPVPSKAVEVRFDGELKEYWDNQYHCVTHENYTSVMAVPYDLFVSGCSNEAVSKLRL